MKLKRIAVVLILSIAFFSCKKTTTTPSSSNSTTTNTPVAFTNPTMKPWFDNYCGSCHASGTSSAGRWLYNPNDYTNSIKGSMSSIYRTVYTQKSMPQGMLLSSTELSKFKTWYDAGYSAN